MMIYNMIYDTMRHINKI